MGRREPETPKHPFNGPAGPKPLHESRILRRDFIGCRRLRPLRGGGCRYVLRVRHDTARTLLRINLKTYLKMALYHKYTKTDELCQTNGYFSLNLRKKAVRDIIELLELDTVATVAWVGCGDGRELLSVAKEHPETQFDAFEINEVALHIAQRVAKAEGVTNVRLHYQDFLTLSPDAQFSHVYSTAISGQKLYDKIFQASSRKVCVLKEMWSEQGFSQKKSATVYLMGSGERRQLVCGDFDHVNIQST